MCDDRAESVSESASNYGVQDMVIWKYELRLGDQFVEVPSRSQFISVSCQGDQLVAWAIVDDRHDVEADRVRRLVRVMGTGWPCEHWEDGCFAFVGTVQQTNGLVWHVFVKETS